MRHFFAATINTTDDFDHLSDVTAAASNKKLSGCSHV
ncbi:hypothetical protein AT5A_03950 [Agrobacterium tumefaciens 5A]|nr:hypothetical protein AT5A_03950 [Agrobacterium tumefaciens 5A]